MYHPGCSCGMCAAESLWRISHGIPLTLGNYRSEWVMALARSLQGPRAREAGDGGEDSAQDDLPF